MKVATKRRIDDPGLDTGSDAGLEAVGPATHPARDAGHFRRIVAGNEAIVAAEQDLRAAVAAARKAGDSWALIGAALGVTKQAEFQRFGRR